MGRVLLWLLALAGAGAALFFWQRAEDLRGRLDGLVAQTQTTTAGVTGELNRLKEMEDALDGLDRAFARGLNGQDAIARALATITTSPDQAEARAALEARVAKLRDDLEPSAKQVRTMLLAVSPPPYRLDADKVTLDANTDFLARIDADPSYTRTPSGLRYKALKAVPAGLRPTAESEVSVHYKGTFIEGTEFDSSYKGGEPASFLLDQLIPGWTEGIALMREGETFEFVLPYQLAYGIAGRGGIPPRQTLVFQVELLKVLSNPAPEPEPTAVPGGVAPVTPTP